MIRGRKTAAQMSIRGQVNELENSLHETDHALTENEKLLSDYRLANTLQTREMDELRSELTRSREILASTRCRSPPSPHYHQTCQNRHHVLAECTPECACVSKLSHNHENHDFNGDNKSQKNWAEPSTHITTPSLKSASSQLANGSSSRKKSESYDQKIRQIEEKLNKSVLSKTEGAFEDLTLQVSQLKHDLWQKEASEKRREMLQQIKGLENDLSKERESHSSSVRQTRKLSTQVKLLGDELGQVRQEKEKALSCLEATSNRLEQTLDGREELSRKVEDLRQALARSERERVECVEKCGQLSQDCFKQEVCQEALRQRIKDVESKVELYKNERLSLENDQQLLLQELSEKTLSECRFQDQTLLLQQKVAELQAALIGREEEIGNLVGRLGAVEKESNDDKMEIVQLNANLKTMEEQKNSLDYKIQTLEDDLHETHSEFEKLRAELAETINRLSQRSKEKVKLESKVEERRRKYEECVSQKKAMQGYVSKLERQIADAEKKQATSHSEAMQAVKKFKAKVQTTAKEKTQLAEENSSLKDQNKELQKKIADSQATITQDQCRLSQMEQEITGLSSNVTSLQNQNEEEKEKNEVLHHKIIDLEAVVAEERNNLEKCQHELKQSENDNENLKHEIQLLKQNLETSIEQAHATKKRLTTELSHTKEFSEAQLNQLKSEIEMLQSEQSKLTTKHKKLLTVHQTLKREHDGYKLEYECLEGRKKQLEKSLEQMCEDIAKKEQDFLNKAETWKSSQIQELKKLKQKHSQVTLKLQETVACLESRLGDEQAVLHELKRQQLKSLDEQQKIYADDLSRSMEDTERVREKYLKAKKIYEDKASSLQSELSDYSGENASLRQRLMESQSSLVQQLEEHESILRAAAKEVDTIVHQMGVRVDVPMFPIIVGDETDIKKWMADMLAKLKWLQKEITHLLAEESKLRHRAKLEIKNDTTNSCQ